MLRPRLLLFLPVLLIVIAFFTACADDGAGEGEAAATSAADIAAAGREEAQVQSTVVEPVPETPVEDETAVAAAVAGATGAQSAGEMVDGLRLDDIRWDDKGSYFRIVFDLSLTSGETVAEAPRADALMSPDGTVIEVTLGGIRGISEQPNVFAQELEPGGVVTSMQRLPAMDDQALVYRIDLSSAATYTLDSLGSPGRVVVDIYY